MIPKLQIGSDQIRIKKVGERDFLCLSDMVANVGKEDSIKNWIKNKDTIEYLGGRERINNENFNEEGFGELRSQAGGSRFIMSPQKRKEATNAVGIISLPGKGGGTYAHMDIALKFATHLSPMFELYITKDYQRIKKIEQEKINSQWDHKRVMAKVNYGFMTDSIKQNLIPENVSQKDIGLVFAEEADLVNLALFNMTAAERKKNFPKESKEGNMRDYATPEQLVVLTNLEFKNSELIGQKVDAGERLKILNDIAIQQMKKLSKDIPVKKVLPGNHRKYLSN